MPFLTSLPDNAGPPNIFLLYPEIYRPWAEMSEALMNGPSSLTRAERELILSFAAGKAGCSFVCTAHAEVAYALGASDGLVDALLNGLDEAPVSDRFRTLLRFVSVLAEATAPVTKGDVDAMLATGWDEKAIHDAIAVTARAAFMAKLVAGFGFTPLDPNVAREHARKRAVKGYVNVYRRLAADPSKPVDEQRPPPSPAATSDAIRRLLDLQLGDD